MRADLDGFDGSVESARGSVDRLRSLFEMHYASLVTLARVLVDDRGAAEDLAQEAFIRLQPRLERIQDPAAYLRVTVVNLARSNLRRRRTVRAFLRRQQHEEPFSADSTGRIDDHEAVLAMLRSLPARQREVLALRYLLDLSEREIAETLTISAGSVKTHASRGLAAGAAFLGEPAPSLGVQS